MAKVNKKKYNHIFSVSFQIDSNYKGDEVPAHELLEALGKRLDYLRTLSDEEVEEAVGIADDSYESY